MCVSVGCDCFFSDGLVMLLQRCWHWLHVGAFLTHSKVMRGLHRSSLGICGGLACCHVVWHREEESVCLEARSDFRFHGRCHNPRKKAGSGSSNEWGSCKIQVGAGEKGGNQPKSLCLSFCWGRSSCCIFRIDSCCSCLLPSPSDFACMEATAFSNCFTF
jgi:hypothetical protein